MAVINGMNHYIAENVSDMGADGFRVRRLVMIGDFRSQEVSPENAAAQSGIDSRGIRFPEDPAATMLQEIGNGRPSAR